MSFRNELYNTIRYEQGSFVNKKRRDVMVNDYNGKLEKKFYLYLAGLPLVLSVLVSFFIIIFFRFLPPKMPLFYSLPWGDAQLATPEQFFIIPGIITLVNLVNLSLIWHLHFSQKFFKNILIISSLIVSLILLTTFIKIFLIFA